MSKDGSIEKFGMFKAVFTPSILTILGVIMYQRFGWVVGNGGLITTIIIIVLAHVISITTGLSVASIATTRTVKAGGDYYIISRSLGLTIGGAIGIAFYFTLALSVALYLIGFAESFNDILGLGSGIWSIRITALVGLAVLTILTWISTSLALKTQYVVLVAIILSIISLFTGDTESVKDPIITAPKNGESFEVLFAVFFPAVTGFTAGVAMSGDLKDPRKSIPLGTILAILVGMVVYIIIAIFLVYKVDTTLLKDRMVWFKVSSVPALVAAGVWGATISSALGCILGAPRTLQALSKDNIAPKIFQKGRGVLNEPTWALFITVVIAALTIVVGELNFIARILSMAYLTSYGFINLSYALERWTDNPSFRPSFKVPAYIGFIGAIVSFLIMFKLDMFALIAATIFMSLIYLILKRVRLKSSIGDTWSGFWSAMVRRGLLKLRNIDDKGRNWRPNMLLFGGNPTKRPNLLNLGDDIIQEKGVITYFYILQKDLNEDNLAEIRRSEKDIEPFFTKNFPHIFTKMKLFKNIYEGIYQISRNYGFTNLEPNTVMLGWPVDQKDGKEFDSLLYNLMVLQKNIFILDYDKQHGFGEYKTIDIWWGGLENNGSLMLTIASLLSLTDRWMKATIRVNVVVKNRVRENDLKKDLEKILINSRVKAIPNIISKEEKKGTISEIIGEISKGIDLVILGLRKPKNVEDSLTERIENLKKGLHSVLLVKASDDFNNNPQVLFTDEE